MVQKYKLLVGNGKDQTAQTIDIEQGTGNQTQPVMVKAQAGMRYQLAQANTPKAPHNVRAKRVGKDLQVFLEDSQQANLVIQNYYDETPTGVNALVGQAENGSVYSYIPEDANAAGLIPNLTDGGNLVGMALGSYEEFMLAAVPLVAAGTGGVGMGALAAGLGLATLAGGGGGGGAAATDTTAPTGQTGALAAASDTGTQGDNLTSNKTPIITGKAEAGAKVEVTINGKTYTTTADANGNYSVNVTDTLPDGTYTPEVKVTDAAGNASTATGTPFTIDTSTSVFITDPGKGTTTNAISGTGEPGATVTVKDAQNNPVGTTTVDKNGNWTLTPSTPVVVGQLKASATDAAGNTANAQSDNTGTAPPVPAITSVTDNVQGQTGAIQKYVAGVSGGLGQGVTNDSTPTVNGTAAPGATVTLYDAGQPVGSATVGPDGKWSITPALSTDGVHTFTARATLAGMSSAPTGDYPILLDTTGPTTPVVDPTGNNNNTGTGTGNTYAVIDNVGAKTGVVADQSTIDDATPVINGKGEVGATVTIYDKGQPLGTAVVGVDGTWSFKPSTPFANGSTHTITTTLTDAAGNTSAPSAGTTFTIDTSNTPVQLTNITDDVAAKTGTLNPNDVTNDNKPTLTGTGTPNTTVTIADNGNTIGTAQVDAQGHWTFTPTNPLSEGSHSFVVSGTDKASNPSSTKPFSLTVDTQAPAAPVISVFADDVGTVQNPSTPTAQTTDDTTPTLKGTAEAGSTITLKDAAGAVVGTVKADGQGQWSYTLAALPKDGNYSYTATATDTAGNISPDSNTFSLTLDTTPPSGQTGALAQVPTSDSGTVGDNLTNVRTPVITGKAEPGAQVEVTVNGKTYPTTADDKGNYSVSIPITDALSDGAYTPQIKVTDAAGNTSTVNGTPFTVDASAPNAGNAPVVTITTDANNDGTVNGPELGGGNNIAVQAAFDKTKVTVGDVVTFSDGNTTTTVTLTQADIDRGFATASFTKPAEGANLTVTAVIRDAANNQTAPGSDNAILDTTAPNGGNAPTVTITTDANNDGWVNSAELGNDSTFAVRAAFDKTKVAVGDVVTFNNGSTSTQVTLTQADINNGFASTTFTKPAEGATLTVNAKITDTANNQTGAGSDSATLDTITPNTNAAPTVTITTDANDDGWVNSAELGAGTTFAVRADFDNTRVAVGDRVVFNDGSTTMSVTLTPTDIANGYVTTTFTQPAEGTRLTVTATVNDAANNQSAPGSDSARLDTIAPNGGNAPTVTITTDADNDGYVNSAELGSNTTFAVQAAFDKTKVAVGDVVTFNAGGTDTSVTLTQADIDNGYASVTFTKPAEGATLNVTATIRDTANNQTAPGTDSAKLDTTAPALTNAAVGLSIAISTDTDNDGYVNTAELATATQFTSHIGINSTAVAGDKVLISATNDGTALPRITHVLTAAEIANGGFDVTFDKPAEGKIQNVSATYADAAGNPATDAPKTDSATLDTIAPTLTNAAVGLSIAISTDTDNDGYVNTAELATATQFTSHIGINSTAVAGDKVLISATNDGTALPRITHVLTAAEITAGGFDVTFDKPAEGKIQNVSATYADAAGNPATDAPKTDSATLDTIAPNGGNAPTVTITTDANNDGTVNNTELAGSSTFSVNAGFDKTKVAVGDVVTFSDGVTTTSVTLTQADINNGFASATFTKPAEGATQIITATIRDAAHNQTAPGTDSATLDTTAPNGGVAPTVTITTDTNNDGWVNIAELGNSTTFAAQAAFDKTKVAVGDIVTFSDGSTTTSVTLTQADIANGYVNTTFAKPAEGATMTVTAYIHDAANNSTLAGNDSAKLDTTAPALTNTAVGLRIAISTDINDDGYVNTTELASATQFTSHISFNSSALAGDKVIITASNDGSALTPVTHVLTAAEITAGGFDVTFNKPAEGKIQNVSTTYADAAGNPATDAPKTDSATLDTIAPNGGNAPTVTITTDANNDGTVNSTELGGGSTFSVNAGFDKTKVAVGDVVTFSDGVTTTSVTLTQADIDNGFASATFTKPAEGATQTITATIHDAAHNQTAPGTDSATLDTTAPNGGVAPTVTITTDANNDGWVNIAELGNSTTFAAQAAFDKTKVAVGDIVTFSDGSTSTSVTLTQADINNGYVNTTFVKPAEGATMTVTANIRDSVNNLSDSGSDSAKLDTIAPNNVGTAPTVIITTDANNDGYVNNSELNGSNTFAVRAVFDPARVAVGDVVTFNNSNTSQQVTLTQADIDLGYVNTSFTKPAEGATMTVTANIHDAANNPTAFGSDSATLDTITPNAGAAPTVTITTDTNNDGWVNIAELGSSTTFAVQAAFDKTKVTVGDVVTFNNGSASKSVTLTQTDINNGYASTTFNKPAEGATLTVTAIISDTANNQTAAGNDSATLDTIAPNNVGNAPTVTITTDTNNDGVVSATELGNSTTFAVRAQFDPARVSVGDTVTLTDGITNTPIVLTQADIDRGYVDTSFAKPAEGATLTVTANIHDAANNTTVSGSDSAQLVTIASSNTAPSLTASAVGGTYISGSTTGVDLYSSVLAQVGSSTANSSEVTAGQKFQTVVLTVSGLLDGSNELLTMAGTSVALTNGNTTTVTGGWQVSIAGSGSIATVTLTHNSGVSAATLQTFIDGWSYTNTKSTLTVGERTFTITSLKDTGGTTNNGVDTSTLNIVSTVGDGNPSVAGSATTTPLQFSGSSGGSDNKSLAGYSVSSVGDVNGDGVEDFLVSAPGLDPYVSRTYVVFGKAGNGSGVSPINLSAIEAGAGGFVLYEQNAYDHSGFSISGIGDINGDGLADFIIGAPYAGDLSVATPNNGHNEGERGYSYVVYGKTSTTSVNLSSIAAGNGGFLIKGEDRTNLQAAPADRYNNDNSGYAVSGAGDVNGDGISDLIIGAPGWSTSPSTGNLEGRTYVVFGKVNNSTIDLAAVANGNGGYAITGQSTDKSGFSVSSAGDVNGDGLADLIIGAPSNNTSDGHSYVVFGKANGNAVNLADVATGTDGFIINGLATGDLNNSGYFVSSAGDVNGDGLADVIVGEPYSGTSGAGTSYVIFGKTNTQAVNVTSVAAGIGGFAIKGEIQPAGASSGWSVSSAGDINGDGLADLLVGSPFTTNSGIDSGTAYVVFGKTNGTTVNLSSVLSGNGGFAINGPKNGYNAWSISAAGDVNGDGFADLIVGVPSSGPFLGAIQPGSSYLIYGGTQYASGSNVSIGAGSSADEFVVGTTGSDVLMGGGGIDRFSAGAGDDTIVLTPSDVTNLANNTTANFKAFVNGGEGFDTLRLTSGANLDLTAISNVGAMGLEENSRIESIERIDMATDASANTTTIRLKDVIDMSELNLFNSGTSGLSLVSGPSLGSLVQKHQVMITGGANDAVNMNLASDWSNSGTVVSYNNHNYVVYNANNNVAAQLLIDQQIVNAVLIA